MYGQPRIARTASSRIILIECMASPLEAVTDATTAGSAPRTGDLAMIIRNCPERRSLQLENYLCFPPAAG